MSGLVSYHAGLAAEEAVERVYLAEGLTLAARRWRGKAGEIDLVFRERDGGGGAGIVVVEVKKSRDFARAAERLSLRQLARIFAAASEFLAREPRGQLTPVRVDLATVDAAGQVRRLCGLTPD